MTEIAENLDVAIRTCHVLSLKSQLSTASEKCTDARTTSRKKKKMMRPQNRVEGAEKTISSDPRTSVAEQGGRVVPRARAPSNMSESPPDLVPMESAAAAGDGFLVHTKHTCDVCFKQPIVGKRYASGVRANFDMCARCFGAYDGRDLSLVETALGASFALRQD